MKSIFRNSDDYKDIATINIVPIVGLLTALMVIFLIGMPKLETAYSLEFARGCFLSVDKNHLSQTANISLDANGIATINNGNDSFDQLAQWIEHANNHSNHSISVNLFIDKNASYGSVTNIIEQLNNAGLPAGAIVMGESVD